jgi:hypothetical protein
MTVLREHLSAWAVVALLAGAALLAWGPAGTRDSGQTLACNERAAAPHALRLPRADAWTPDAVLAGLPEATPAGDAYELSEARSMERYRGGVPVVRFAASLSDPAPEAGEFC